PELGCDRPKRGTNAADLDQGGGPQGDGDGSGSRGAQLAPARAPRQGEVVHHWGAPSWIPPASAGGGGTSRLRGRIEAPAEQGRGSRFAARADLRLPPTTRSSSQTDGLSCEA